MSVMLHNIRLVLSNKYRSHYLPKNKPIVINKDYITPSPKKDEAYKRLMELVSMWHCT